MDLRGMKTHDVLVEQKLPWHGQGTSDVGRGR